MRDVAKTRKRFLSVMTEAMEACVYRVYKIEPGVRWPDVSLARGNCSTQFDELKVAVRLNGFFFECEVFVRAPRRAIASVTPQTCRQTSVDRSSRIHESLRLGSHPSALPECRP